MLFFLTLFFVSFSSCFPSPGFSNGSAHFLLPQKNWGADKDQDTCVTWNPPIIAIKATFINIPFGDLFGTCKHYWSWGWFLLLHFCASLWSIWNNPKRFIINPIWLKCRRWGWGGRFLDTLLAGPSLGCLIKKFFKK